MVTFDDDRLRPVLAYLANRAVQPLAPRAAMHYAVRGLGPYELFEEGDRLASVGRPDDVLYVLYQRCHARLYDYLSLSGWIGLHAALVAVGGRRAIVIGDKGAGKTTLALRLVHDGHDVEGDEVVFVRDGDAVCLPRNFHVKPGAPALVPELAERWEALPRTSTSDGLVIGAYDPSSEGFRWNLSRGPVDAAFVLLPDFGGRTQCRPLSSVEVVASAVANSFPSSGTKGTVVRACAKLLGGVAGYELTVGDVASAAHLLVGIVAA